MNTFIYITGLPDDVTKEELRDHFVRCGVIRLDPNTGEDQIRIYTNDQGIPKGDARIGYAMIESVNMAVEMLNEKELRPGYVLTVCQAEF